MSKSPAASRKTLFGMFAAEPSASTLVNIAGPQEADPFFKRAVHLGPRGASREAGGVRALPDEQRPSPVLD
jgi:hypothetical protein